MDMVRVFGRDGILIDQIRTMAERSWVLVKETSARFYVSVYDPKCNPFTLNYGNIILIENSDGLPPFVGIIDGRGFESGAALIEVFTPERFFLYRRGPSSLTLTGSAGEIFAQMIRYINTVENTALAVGDIDSNSGRMQETLNPVPIVDNLARIVERSGEGYRWRPEVVNGQLTIYGDWFSDMVMDTGLILHDGHNVSGDHPLSETPPLNDVMMYGNGEDWMRRITDTEVDSASKERYGLRQYSENIQTPSLNVLKVAAVAKLKESKEPKTSFPLSALNVGDTFSRLEPGALVTLTRLVGAGFSQDGLGYESDSNIILGMDYNPADGTVPLALWTNNAD